MSAGTAPSAITRAFEGGRVDAATFHHEQHLRVAYDLLRRDDFIDAAATYAKGLRALAAAAGAPEKFNLTLTYAFLSLIAERLAAAPATDFEAFVARNPDLLSKQLLERWYGRERLQGALARRVFLLPETARPAGPT